MTGLVSTAFKNAKDWETLLKDIIPTTEERKALSEAFGTVKGCLKAIGEVQLRGSVDQDLFVRGNKEIDVLVLVDDFHTKKHEVHSCKECALVAH
jgi:tRNA nucleotidyltransferase (CCA-adding enzyme)